MWLVSRYCEHIAGRAKLPLSHEHRWVRAEPTAAAELQVVDRPPTSTRHGFARVKAVTAKGKLSSSLLQGIVDAALNNIQSDSQLVSTLYRYHKKASPPNKLTSLYLVDGIAREARSRQKKLDREGKGKGREGAAHSPATPAVGSTTPTNSPPPAASPAPTAAAGTGSYASFLKILEGGMLAKFVVDNWENGLPEHRDKVRKVLDIWTKAATFSPSALARISQKLLATSSSAPPPRPRSPTRPSLSPGASYAPLSLSLACLRWHSAPVDTRRLPRSWQQPRRFLGSGYTSCCLRQMRSSGHLADL
ncbi:hypothetical protein DMC30DRAFT_298575 [Rhodotorula diobovata]|uniref:CID domain-containing protein n=1 Tax=Rhodotorula diobovata TaxID=5288 RepID=A0A5C5FS05_9BASI|nr:hypothetical protein DMC30DRAFT_298575 [Rhodotorula diobovata]